MPVFEWFISAILLLFHRFWYCVVLRKLYVLAHYPDWKIQIWSYWFLLQFYFFLHLLAESYKDLLQVLSLNFLSVVNWGKCNKAKNVGQNPSLSYLVRRTSQTFIIGPRREFKRSIVFLPVHPDSSRLLIRIFHFYVLILEPPPILMMRVDGRSGYSLRGSHVFIDDSSFQNGDPFSGVGS